MTHSSTRSVRRDTITTTTPFFLDIYRQDGSFYTQLRYTKRGFPRMIDGRIVEVHNSQDICSFVEQRLPSLIGTDYRALPSSQRIYK